MLLLASSLDANNHIVLLAWAIVESENQYSWQWFITHLITAIPEAAGTPEAPNPPETPPRNTRKTVMISDREKGLREAIDRLAPGVIGHYCCWHLNENLCTKFGRGLSPLFWRIARAPNAAKFYSEMNDLQKINASAFEYLAGIPPILWATAFFPGARYGQDTSNIAEAANSQLKIAREAPIVDLLHRIWGLVSGQRFDRLGAIAKQPPEARWTPYTATLIQEEQQFARTFTTQLTTSLLGQALDSSGGVFRVDLVERTCSCPYYRHYTLPCRHAMACIYAGGSQLNEFIPEAWSIETWKATYAETMDLVDISGLQGPAPGECHPPNTRVPRGRPRKNRFHKKDNRGAEDLSLADLAPGATPPGPVRRYYHCSTCGQPGHSAVRCRKPHN